MHRILRVVDMYWLRVFVFSTALGTLTGIVFRHFHVPVPIQEALGGILTVGFLAGIFAERASRKYARGFYDDAC